MSKATINAERRDGELNPRQLRSAGSLPATVYGGGMESVSVKVAEKDFVTAYKQDKNALFDVITPEETYSTIVKNVQMDAVSRKFLNIEFQRVKTDVKVKLTVPVKVVGVSPAVKAGGQVVSNITAIEVDCLPQNIPGFIEVDISGLEQFEDSVKIAEITYPEGVTPITPAEVIVLKIATPRAAKGQAKS